MSPVTLASGALAGVMPTAGTAKRCAQPGRVTADAVLLPPGGNGGLAARLEAVAAAEVGRLAGLAASMLGSGNGLGVLEQVMGAALTASGGRLLEAPLGGEDRYAPTRLPTAGTKRSPPCSARSRCAGRGTTARHASAGSLPATSSWASAAARCRRAWPR